jgi:seryl-tRNA synthetase
MLTSKYLRDNIEAIKESMARRKSDYPVDEMLKLDEKLRKANMEVQQLRAERNRLSLEIADKKKKENVVDKDITAKVSDIKERLDTLEKELPEDEKRLNTLLWNMPNILDKSVPYGVDDSQNVEIKVQGKAVAKNLPGHEEILTKLGTLDLEAAAKVSGARFYYLKGDLALLEQALIRFAIDELIAKGYTLISPPLMMRKEYYRGATALGDFEELLYMVTDPKEAQNKKDFEKTDEDLYMIGTSEHIIAAMYSDHVFSAKELPLRFIGISPCFRREAGSHGKDTKGIFRVHQFYKVEQFIFAEQENSYTLFDELIANSEELFKKLGIPYHIVNICTGDIGTTAAKKYDLEAFMPVQNKYREMVSCSNCTDWQSIRLDIKYDKAGERKYVHTLNSTALAIERAIVAIVENYADEDGTVRIPDALVKYMGKERIRKQ